MVIFYWIFSLYCFAFFNNLNLFMFASVSEKSGYFRRMITSLTLQRIEKSAINYVLSIIDGLVSLWHSRTVKWKHGRSHTGQNKTIKGKPLLCIFFLKRNFLLLVFDGARGSKKYRWIPCLCVGMTFAVIKTKHRSLNSNSHSDMADKISVAVSRSRVTLNFNLADSNLDQLGAVSPEGVSLKLFLFSGPAFHQYVRNSSLLYEP